MGGIRALRPVLEASGWSIRLQGRLLGPGVSCSGGATCGCSELTKERAMLLGSVVKRKEHKLWKQSLRPVSKFLPPRSVSGRASVSPSMKWADPKRGSHLGHTSAPLQTQGPSASTWTWFLPTWLPSPALTPPPLLPDPGEAARCPRERTRGEGHALPPHTLSSVRAEQAITSNVCSRTKVALP